MAQMPQDVITQNPDHPVRVALKLTQQLVRQSKDNSRIETYLRAAMSAPELHLEPLIESVKPDRLRELINRARQNDPEYAPADFSSWFQVTCPAELQPQALTQMLRRLDVVETAYVMRAGPPPLVPGDDPRNANQGYLDAAPNGIDARYAWGFAGGDGTNTAYVDLEQGWNLNHEDLSAAGITLMSGLNNAYFSHGTAVLGEMSMVDNTLGGVGIAPAARGRVISQHRSAASYNTTDAIVSAVADMAFGDILLLEAQEYDPVSGDYFWPVEIADANYEAIRLATALGVVVVEAACNGGYDLDAYTNGAGAQIFNRSTADFRDSGAIMVGAASSASPHTRLGFSNFGNRIDCYAWGQSVDTTSTDVAGTNNTLYTTTFGGTSSASPIITGAGLIVQGLAQASLGYRFGPRTLRNLLVSGGTPSSAPSDLIGVMPNLHSIITGNVLNLAPDLYLRDYVGDTGEPTTGFVSQSPDIIVRQAAVADPQASYGPGSGTENSATLSQDVVTGQDHFVYVRGLNRGGSPADNVSVDVYWAPPSTLVTPNLWNLIGTATIPSIATGNVLSVANGLTWSGADIPAAGHYCFVAVAGNTQDPKPDPASFGTFDNFVTYVENNNNIAWRNFNVVVGPPSVEMKFLIPGAFDTTRRFQLEGIGQLPRGSRVSLEMPAWLADGLRPFPMKVEHDVKKGIVRVPLHPSGLQAIGTATLHANSKAECRLLVSLGKTKHPCQFAVRQLYGGKEVGRVTWHFKDDDDLKAV